MRSTRTSNGKSTGIGNRKNGNKYLAWAYVEAANIAKRHYPIVDRYYRKEARANESGSGDQGDQQVNWRGLRITY